jgi:hypothetical protein
MWMSDTPQERIMMYNNGRLSWGSALVGGLGLGLYLQYAASGMAGKVTRFTVIERSPVVVDVVRPTLDVSLGVPLQIRIGDVATYLSKPSNMRYDTIFLDTWDTLDAAHLPAINRLRDLALRRLAPGGQVLLWGYRWMVRLFEEACRQLLAVTPGQRRAWLTARAEASPKGVALLTPVLDYVDEQAEKDAQSVLDWCRQYIVQRVVQV